MPVGDLDGDGTGDLLDIRYADNSDNTTTVASVAHRASDGAALWTQRLRLSGGDNAFAVPATIGSPARAGVVLLRNSFRQSADGSGTGNGTLTLTGLGGRDGRQLWSTSRTGTLGGGDAGSFSGTTVPAFAGLAGGGATSQFVLDVQDFHYSFDQGSCQSQSGTSRPMRLDGANGRLSPIGAPLSRDDAVPVVGAVPDATGDGVGDVSLLVAGGTPEVSLRRTDGDTVWTRTGLPLNDGAYVAPAGQVVGSAAGDLAVLTGTPSDPADGAPTGLPRTAAAHGDVLLLDGTDGTGSSSSVPGDEVLPLGRAGASCVPAYAAVRQDRTSDANSTTTTLTTDARDAAGTLLWSRALQFTVDDPDADGFGFAYPIGDLDRAGASDLQATIYVFSKGGQKERQYRFDGTTGAILRRSGEALFGSLSSHGEDLVTVDPGQACW